MGLLGIEGSFLEGVPWSVGSEFEGFFRGDDDGQSKGCTHEMEGVCKRQGIDF